MLQFKRDSIFKMASFHTEFSLESVRQYMLMKDGQVTNHELVKHFKHWLTHPTQSEISRQKFKEYVNTLATIKQVHIVQGYSKSLQLYSKGFTIKSCKLFE